MFPSRISYCGQIATFQLIDILRRRDLIGLYFALDITSKLVLGHLQNLDQVRKHNEMQLIFSVPGHSAIKDKQPTDRLANKGFRRSMICVQLFCAKKPRQGVSNAMDTEKICTLDAKCRTTVSQKIHQIFRHSTQAIGTMREQYISRKSLLQLLKNICISDADSCEFCEGAKNTSHHIMCECPAICTVRCRVYDEHFIRSEPKKVSGFIRNLKLKR